MWILYCWCSCEPLCTLSCGFSYESLVSKALWTLLWFLFGTLVYFSSVLWVWLMPPSTGGGPYGTTWLGGILFIPIGFCLLQLHVRGGSWKDWRLLLVYQNYVFIPSWDSWRFVCWGSIMVYLMFICIFFSNVLRILYLCKWSMMFFVYQLFIVYFGWCSTLCCIILGPWGHLYDVYDLDIFFLYLHDTHCNV